MTKEQPSPPPSSGALGARVNAPSPPVPSSFSTRIRGESRTPLELHLQSCIQALMVVYQDHLFEDDQHNDEFTKSERKWVAGLERPAPAEVPITVCVRGNQIELRESKVLGEVLADVEASEMAKKVRSQPEGFKQIYLDNVQAELKYRDDVVLEAFDNHLLPALEEKCEGKMRKGKDESYIFPKEAFVKGVAGLMGRNHLALKRLSDEYGTPPQLDTNILRASGQFRS